MAAMITRPMLVPTSKRHPIAARPPNRHDASPFGVQSADLQGPVGRWWPAACKGGALLAGQDDGASRRGGARSTSTSRSAAAPEIRPPPFPPARTQLDC